jgi:hypothetical protein
MRKHIGVALLAVSVLYSAVDLLGLLRPMFLRMRAHAGAERTFALVIGSVSLKAVLLLTGALLAFWPERKP